MAFIKLSFDSAGFDRNQREELAQRVAWRLVRSAEDSIKGNDRGPERFSWCVSRMRIEFPDLSEIIAMDHVRAAFVNFKG